MSSFRTLNIGMTALLTQKLALDTVGQNIANASTPGYARQRVDMRAGTPQMYTYGAVGTGVDVRKIEHLTDEFLEVQVRGANSDKGALDVSQSGYENIEVYFNELTDNDISSAFDNFWDSMQDWNNNVEDISSRRNVASQAETLCDSFRSVRQKISDYRYQQNQAIRDTVGDINELTTQVSVLNAAIMKGEAGGATGVSANDLRDQRNELIKQLSNYVDCTVTNEKNSSVTVTQKGRILVYQDQNFPLTTESVNSGGMIVDNIIFASDREEVELSSGKLYGMIQMRDQVSKSYIDDLDQLAASFIWEMNRTHSQGVGLTGYTELAAKNEILDPNVTLDQVKYNFTPEEGTFQIKDGSFELKVYDAASNQSTTMNIDIDLDNPNVDDRTILANTEPTLVGSTWQVVQPENSLMRKMQDALDKVAPNTFTVELDYGNQLKITSNTEDMKFSFGRDSSGVLAALGLNTLFSGHDAETIGVQPEYTEHPEYLAGAESFVPGDQSNSLKLLNMRTTATMSGGTASFEDYYQGIIGRLGIEGSRIDSLQKTQTDILVQVENQRESLSGVNLDEELTQMIQFQTSYRAAAQFVSTAQGMYDALLGMMQ